MHAETTVKTLAYANNPAKAAELMKWLQALAPHLEMDLSIVNVRGAGGPEAEAARMIAGALDGSGGAVPRMIERSGAPEEAIADEARENEYSLVALVPAGRRGFIRLFYGSMVAHVVQRVSTSVLVVREGHTVPPSKILVCVSGCRHSLTNVTLAAQMASRFGSKLQILMVLSQVSVDMKGADTWAVDPARFTETDHPLASHLRVAQKVAEEIGVQPGLGVRTGMISDEILKEVRHGGHDLLVLGTHRAEDFDTAYEDITDEVLQASGVTTLVVGLRASLF